MATTFDEALAPLARRMPRPVRDIEVLRVAAHLNGENFESSANIARKAALAWAKM